jgi:hypothetical protein
VSDHEASAVEWRDIPGYEGLYQVSSDGQVKRLGGSAKARNDRLLRAANNGLGYFIVTLSKNGVTRSYRLHRLVALAFFGESNLPINHKNGVKTDNRIENLEYVTPSENSQHAWNTGLIPRITGEAHWSSKLSDEEAAIIHDAMKFIPDEVGGVAGLAREFGVSETTIRAVINRTRRYAE